MSEPAPAPRFFQPVTLLAGIVLGLLALAWAGRAVTGRDWHRDFHRFHPLISAETQYLPTIAEMRAIVRARCRPDQILVIVGGNSILQGVGQSVGKLWSRRLQELLGDRYAVVNLAFRGSSPTDAGALVAESLRDEYPRLIYLANVQPFKGSSPGGSLDYFFMLLDAHHKGWLIDFPARTAVIDDLLSRPDLYPRAREQALEARLDAWLRFRELWNWWSATRCFTFPTPRTPGSAQAFRPRNAFPDLEPDFADTPFRERFADRFTEAEMQITRNTSAPFYRPGPAPGQWLPHAGEFLQFRKIAAAAFPAAVKARTLIILSRNSPYYTRKLTEAERARDELSFHDGILEWRKLGYGAMEYGPDFTDQDFGDRTHLTVEGGQKLAARVAPQIRALATQLGYPNP